MQFVRVNLSVITFPTADSRKDSKGNLSELVLPIKAMLKQNYWTFFCYSTTSWNTILECLNL